MSAGKIFFPRFGDPDYIKGHAGKGQRELLTVFDMAYEYAVDENPALVRWL